MNKKKIFLFASLFPIVATPINPEKDRHKGDHGNTNDYVDDEREVLLHKRKVPEHESGK
jgi:hypothetical protein